MIVKTQARSKPHYGSDSFHLAFVCLAAAAVFSKLFYFRIFFAYAFVIYVSDVICNVVVN